MKGTNYFVAGLLILFIFISIGSIQHKGITNDEATHIPSGYSYWKTGDFRMNVEHPPLIKLIASAPLLVLNPVLPLDHETGPSLRKK